MREIRFLFSRLDTFFNLDNHFGDTLYLQKQKGLVN